MVSFSTVPPPPVESETLHGRLKRGAGAPSCRSMVMINSKYDQNNEDLDTRDTIIQINDNDKYDQNYIIQTDDIDDKAI